MKLEDLTQEEFKFIKDLAESAGFVDVPFKDRTEYSITCEEKWMVKNRIMISRLMEKGVVARITEHLDGEYVFHPTGFTFTDEGAEAVYELVSLQLL